MHRARVVRWELVVNKVEQKYLLSLRVVPGP